MEVGGERRQNLCHTQAEGRLCVRCLADRAGTVTLSSTFLSSVQPHSYLWQSRDVPFPPRKAKFDAWSKGGQPIWSWVAGREERQFPKGVWLAEYLIGTWSTKAQERKKNTQEKFGARFWIDKIRAVLMIAQVWAITEKKYECMRKFVLEAASLKRKHRNGCHDCGTLCCWS